MDASKSDPQALSTLNRLSMSRHDMHGLKLKAYTYTTRSINSLKPHTVPRRGIPGQAQVRGGINLSKRRVLSSTCVGFTHMIIAIVAGDNDGLLSYKDGMLLPPDINFFFSSGNSDLVNRLIPTSHSLILQLLHLINSIHSPSK